MRKPQGCEGFRVHHEAAIDLDGPEVELLSQATADTDIFVVIGVIERDGATVYCTALFFDGERGWWPSIAS